MRLISILLPTLNEEQGIGKTLDAIPIKSLEEMGFSVEILIIDGESKDDTINIAKRKKTKILVTEPGYGHQYILGFKQALGEIIITADSDASYPLHKICDYIKILETENLQFISTNRFAYMDKPSMRAINRYGNIFLTFFTNLLFSINIKDSQSGMWIIKRNALNNLNLTSKGMSLSEEIKIEAFKKLRAREIPSTYCKRLGGTKLKLFQDGITNLLFLFKKKFFMKSDENLIAKSTQI